MKISQKGLNLIKEFESLHDGDLKKIGLQPKMDPVGIWTEGWGHAMRDNKGNFIKGPENKVLAEKSATIHTLEEADNALSEDIKSFELFVTRKLKVPVNQNQFDALVSHTYNTGGSSTLFDLINKKASKEAIYNWFTKKYITSKGIKLKGLIRRRKAEADLFFS
ncbi:lysozyme [Chryseobacterium sp. Alg-005]|uniref:lysozyme n=1 Tax=Chryseobacterium sp. Alg-005 TaxID=3159516 RepID=UPI0035558494